MGERGDIIVKFLVVCVLLIAVGSGCNVGAGREEARKASARVHAHLQSGDLGAIYKEATPAFREIGSETAFVTGLKSLLDRLGALKNARELAYQTGWDSSLGTTHVFFFNLECDDGRATERIVFGKSAAGKMELLRLEIQPTGSR
jgi:hypothetical protein